MIQLVDPEIAPRRNSDLCKSPMKFLGVISCTVRGPAVRVFRCFDCALVTAELFDETRHVWTTSEFSA
jgi:hypothetical protein